MTVIVWSEEYSVGVKALDEQHRQLFDIFNSFAEAVQKHRGQRVAGPILSELAGYTQEHFAFEEKLMAEAGYEGLREHQARHRQVIQKLERFDYELNVEGRRISREVREFLRQWLTAHILEEDLSYRDALAGRTAAV